MLVESPEFCIFAKCSVCEQVNICFEKVNYDDPVNSGVRGQYCLNCIMLHKVENPDGLGFGA